MKRFFDFIISFLLLLILAIPLLLLFLLIISTSEGSALYWSKRIGKNNKIFYMPKFRTMTLDVPEVATHLLKDASSYYTPLGKFLRKYSLDELPQLYSILRGEMSLVGPRPALYNQEDLIVLRTNAGIHKLLPGVTGLAQINGRDELSIQAKVDMDRQYLERRSFAFDLNIIWLTLLTVIRKEGISH